MIYNRINHVSGIQAFFKSNYVYLAIPKNGLCSHSEYFLRKGWQPRHIWEWGIQCTTELTFFSHIRNPVNRYVKGIVQSLKNNDMIPNFIERMEKEPDLLKYVLTSVNDDHTSPITSMFPPTISPYQVNWIPMDHPNPKWNSNFLTNQFFREVNLPYKIEKKDVVHVSDQQHRRVQDYVKHKMFNEKNAPRRGYGCFYTAVMAGDDLLYKHVMRQFKVREPYLEEVFLKEFPDIPKTRAHWYPSKEDLEFEKKKKNKDHLPDVLKTL